MIIFQDEHQTIHSVPVTVARTEKVNSGSMLFHHPRYLTFGQTVVFTDEAFPANLGAALYFPKGNEEAILESIANHIEHEVQWPDGTILIEEVK